MSQDDVINVNKVDKILKHGGEVRVFASPKTVGTSKLIMGDVILQPKEEIIEHLHDYGEEIIYVIVGSGQIYLDGKASSISQGDAFIARQGVRHRIVNDSDSELRLVFACAPLAPTAQQGHRSI